MAVTKRFPPAAVELAVQAGFASIGENYAQELIEKAGAVDTGELAAPSWHMIGGLQRNKIKKLAAIVPLESVGSVVFQTIDRIELADEVAKRLPGSSVFVQVNTTDEGQKSGCAPDEVANLVDAVRVSGLELRGLMTIGPTDGSDPSAAFEMLRQLADRHDLRECSMGMTADLEAAVAAGSTMIRVGSALFGPRPTSLHSIATR